MRKSVFTVAAVVLGLVAGRASAETSDPTDVRPVADLVQATDAQQAETPQAADAKVPDAAAPSLPPAEQAAPAAPAPPKPWTLPEPKMLKDLGIQQYGWVEQGLTFNSLSPANRWNGPVFGNDRSNEYELNQLWLGWERPVKTDGCGWDLGGRIDLMYGSDWRYGSCYGLESYYGVPNLDEPSNLYGLVVPQFFLELAYNNLTVKAGHFAPSVGYEVVAAPGNFFYSHSYALGYSEPVLVTGALADYKLNDTWDLLSGFHDGFNGFEDPNGMLHFIGGAKWHDDKHKESLSLMFDVGPQLPNLIPNAAQDDQWEYTLVYKKQFTEKLLYAFENTFGGTQEVNNPLAPGLTYAKWYGLDQYLIYTLNKKWSAGARVEWFRDQDGTRVAGPGSVGFKGPPSAPGFAGTFTEATIGLNWHPNQNFVVRPECRWDCYTGSTNLQGQLPFGDGARSSQFLFATDLIFFF